MWLILEIDIVLGPLHKIPGLKLSWNVSQVFFEIKEKYKHKSCQYKTKNIQAKYALSYRF